MPSTAPVSAVAVSLYELLDVQGATSLNIYLPSASSGDFAMIMVPGANATLWSHWFTISKP